MQTVFPFLDIQHKMVEATLASIPHHVILICVYDPDIYQFGFEGRQPPGRLQQRMDSPFSSKFPNSFRVPKAKKTKTRQISRDRGSCVIAYWIGPGKPAPKKNL
jgi:hypothetical protein